MSDLTYIEKMRLEKALTMGDGYVLSFSNKTFADFVAYSVGINIYDDKYASGGGSKANRLRGFWDIEPNYIVGKLLADLAEAWPELKSYSEEKEPPDEYLRILQRLKDSAPVPDLASIVPNAEGKDFDTLAKSVRESIEKNEPEAGLDRLHTYLIKYLRVLCQKRGIQTNREKPLHSLMGEYIKSLKSDGSIESQMTERILKSSISVLDAFNTIRNEHSFAHDNEVLNYNESILILSHVASSVRFIQTLENSGSEDQPADDSFLSDELPF